jgi:hypothetical protein
MSPRCATLAWCALALLGCGGAQHPATAAEPITSRSLYPMERGRAWSFDAVARDGTSVLVVSRVVSAEQGVSELTTGQESQFYELRADGIYRRAREAYLLHDPIELGASWPAGGGQNATVSQVGLELETPGGKLTRCVEILEAGAPSGLTVRTVYCPGVGPARVEASIDVRGQQIVERASLRGWAAGPKE